MASSTAIPKIIGATIIFIEFKEILAKDIIPAMIKIGRMFVDSVISESLGERHKTSRQRNIPLRLHSMLLIWLFTIFLSESSIECMPLMTVTLTPGGAFCFESLMT